MTQDSSGQLALRVASARESRRDVAKDAVSIDSTQWAEYVMVLTRQIKKNVFFTKNPLPLLLSQMDPNYKKCGKCSLQDDAQSVGCAALPGNVIAISRR